MEPRVKMLYKAAIKNELFIKKILEDDRKNKKPKWYSDELDKILYATVYYGWLIGRQDPELILYK